MSATADVVDIKRARILVVDDNEANSELLCEILRDAGYLDVTSSRDPEDVPRLCILQSPDLLILDLHMPQMSGFEILAALREQLLSPPYLPVLAVTADALPATRMRALSLGAGDFLTKPVEAGELLLRSRNLLRAHLLARELNNLVAERTSEVQQTQLDALTRLARATEYRDYPLGHHPARVGREAGRIATAMGLPPDAVSIIELAAPLHDMGKVGVPDAVLLKTGPLTPSEEASMQDHVRVGADLLSGSSAPVFIAAAEIARFHHERWDGTGYLEHLAGDQIPLFARITAVADVFDSLTHDRPFRDAWPVTRALEEITDQRNRGFDPRVIDAFLTLDHGNPRRPAPGTSEQPLRIQALNP